MHFIGMLSFSLSIPIGYDLALTGYSLAIAILVSWFALHVVTLDRLKISGLIAGGTLMGFGISGMHYLGMAAMRMNPAIHYDPVIFAASILIAIAASTVALWLTNTLRGAGPNRLMRKRIGAACVMGVAIVGMHYTGMAAADFAVGSICGAAGGVKPQWLALAIVPLSIAILIVTLLLSRLDARATFLSNSITRLNEQIDRIQGPAR